MCARIGYTCAQRGVRGVLESAGITSPWSRLQVRKATNEYPLQYSLAASPVWLLSPFRRVPSLS